MHISAPMETRVWQVRLAAESVVVGGALELVAMLNLEHVHAHPRTVMVCCSGRCGWQRQRQWCAARSGRWPVGTRGVCMHTLPAAKGYLIWQVRLAAAAAAVVGGMMWLMAGWDPGRVHAYPPAAEGTLVWQVRLAAAAAVVGGTMWLVAGWDPGHKRDGGEILSDLWALDLSTWAWRQVQPQARLQQQQTCYSALGGVVPAYLHMFCVLLNH